MLSRKSLKVFCGILILFILLIIASAILVFVMNTFLLSFTNTLLNHEIYIIGLLIASVLVLFLKNIIENYECLCFNCFPIFNFSILNWLFDKINFYNYTIFFVFNNIKIILLLLIGGLMIFTLFKPNASQLFSGWAAFSGIVIGFLYNKENTLYKHQRSSIISLHRIITYLHQINKLDKNDDINEFNVWIIKKLLNFDMIQTFDIQIVIAYLLSKRNSISLEKCDYHNKNYIILKQDLFEDEEDLIKENILFKTCNYFKYNPTQLKCAVDLNFCSFNKRNFEYPMFPEEKNIWSHKNAVKLCIRDKIYNIVLNKYEKENLYEKQLLLEKITKETSDFYNNRHYYHIPKDLKKYIECNCQNNKTNLESLLKKIKYYYNILG